MTAPATIQYATLRRDGHTVRSCIAGGRHSAIVCPHHFAAQFFRSRDRFCGVARLHCIHDRDKRDSAGGEISIPRVNGRNAQLRGTPSVHHVS
jgi:hypothetical protein